MGWGKGTRRESRRDKEKVRQKKQECKREEGMGWRMRGTEKGERKTENNVQYVLANGWVCPTLSDWLSIQFNTIFPKIVNYMYMYATYMYMYCTLLHLCLTWILFALCLHLCLVGKNHLAGWVHSPFSYHPLYCISEGTIVLLMWEESGSKWPPVLNIHVHVLWELLCNRTENLWYIFYCLKNASRVLLPHTRTKA